MTDIQNSIQHLANSFVQEVLKALSNASIADFSSLANVGESFETRGRGRPFSATTSASIPTGRRPGRPPRNAVAAPPVGRGRPKAEPSLAGNSARAAAASRKADRRVRRSSEDVTQLADQVADFIRDQGGNVAVSEIAKGLNLGTADITRPVAIALQEGKIYKTGEKRLTRYFVGDGNEKKSRGRKK